LREVRWLATWEATWEERFEDFWWGVVDAVEVDEDELWDPWRRASAADAD